jgi:hypothetical protein
VEGSASRVLGAEEARESVALGALSGLDHVALEDDSALEPQPGMTKTSSSAPIAVSLIEYCGQRCMRGVQRPDFAGALPVITTSPASAVSSGVLGSGSPRNDTSIGEMSAAQEGGIPPGSGSSTTLSGLAVRAEDIAEGGH